MNRRRRPASCVHSVFVLARTKTFVSRLFSCVYWVLAASKYISIRMFLFLRSCLADLFNKQFGERQICLRIFSVSGTKHAAYCEFSLSLCSYGFMKQNAVQLFSFLGISIFQTIPPSGGRLPLLHRGRRCCHRKVALKGVAPFTLTSTDFTQSQVLVRGQPMLSKPLLGSGG